MVGRWKVIELEERANRIVSGPVARPVHGNDTYIYVLQLARVIGSHKILRKPVKVLE